MMWMVVLVSVATGQVVSEMPYGNVIAADNLAAIRQAEINCIKFSTIKAAEYNKEHADQQVKPECRKQ